MVSSKGVTLPAHGTLSRGARPEVYLLIHPGASGLTFLVDSADLVGESGLLPANLLCPEETPRWPTTTAQEESAVGGADRRTSMSAGGSGCSTSAVTSVSGNLSTGCRRNSSPLCSSSADIIALPSATIDSPPTVLVG
uniref:Uncharacterized protein n=1 Tax=Triticum urartu TaxID=4572 RepID=A0A8R7TW01_TRIUA